MRQSTVVFFTPLQVRYHATKGCFLQTFSFLPLYRSDIRCLQAFSVLPLIDQISGAFTHIFFLSPYMSYIGHLQAFLFLAFFYALAGQVSCNCRLFFTEIFLFYSLIFSYQVTTCIFIVDRSDIRRHMYFLFLPLFRSGVWWLQALSFLPSSTVDHVLGELEAFYFIPLQVRYHATTTDIFLFYPFTGQISGGYRHFFYPIVDQVSGDYMLFSLPYRLCIIFFFTPL
jgi:hypothetical protein